MLPLQSLVLEVAEFAPSHMKENGQVSNNKKKSKRKTVPICKILTSYQIPVDTSHFRWSMERT